MLAAPELLVSFMLLASVSFCWICKLLCQLCQESCAFVKATGKAQRGSSSAVTDSYKLYEAIVMLPNW